MSAVVKTPVFLEKNDNKIEDRKASVSITISNIMG
jgi:hypothetical protein